MHMDLGISQMAQHPAAKGSASGDVIMKSHIDGCLQPELCIYKLVDLEPSVCLK